MTYAMDLVSNGNQKRKKRKKRDKVVYPVDFFNNVYDTMVSRIGSLWDEYKK